MKMSDKISIAALIVSFVSLILFFISFYLNEPYLIPRDPQLKFWINTLGYTATSEGFLPSIADYTTGKYSITREDEKIPICIFNEGRGVTGLVAISWSADWNTSRIVSNIRYIDFIEGGNGTCFYDDIRAVCYNVTSHYLNPCSENQIKSQIPNGIQTINLSIECTFCKNKIETKSFRICIEENSSSECKNNY